MSAANPLHGASDSSDQRPAEPSMEEILASIRRIIADDQALAGRSPAPVARTTSVIPPSPVPIRSPDVLEFRQAETRQPHAHGSEKGNARSEAVEPAPPLRSSFAPQAWTSPPPSPIPPTIRPDAPVAAHAGLTTTVAPSRAEPEAAPPIAPSISAAPAPTSVAAPPIKEFVRPIAAEATHRIAAERAADLVVERAIAEFEERTRAEPAASRVLPIEAPVFTGPKTGASAHPVADTPTANWQPSELPQDARQDNPVASTSDVVNVDELASEVGSTLASNQTAHAVSSAFSMLAATRLAENTGDLMDLAREMLRPMLKTWLDDNLPVMVERLVRAEIERVARGGR